MKNNYNPGVEKNIKMFYKMFLCLFIYTFLNTVNFFLERGKFQIFNYIPLEYYYIPLEYYYIPLEYYYIPLEYYYIPLEYYGSWIGSFFYLFCLYFISASKFSKT